MPEMPIWENPSSLAQTWQRDTVSECGWFIRPAHCRKTLLTNPTTPPDTLALHWPTEDDTRAFAAQLAQQPLLAQVLLTLHGDLGAGKTTLVRHLLRALGVTGRVKSPTYAVVEPYQVPWPWASGCDGGGGEDGSGSRASGGALDIWHFDFYRLGDPREWEDAGLRDLLASPGLKLVEWPDKAGPGLPTPDLALHLHTDNDDDSRHVTLHAHTATGQRCLAGLSHPFSREGSA